MKRKEAIDNLILKTLSAFTPEERSELLKTMLLEDWSQIEGWEGLPSDLTIKFKTEKFDKPTSDRKFDEILKLWLYGIIQAVSNSYIIEELDKFNIHIETIEGDPKKLEACPCCGRRTIDTRGDYDICYVCWWEDDGQDNKNASKVIGGPNYHLSLSKARYNFIKFGISDPERNDLILIKEPAKKYVLGREFRLLNDHKLIEVGSDWSALIERNE